jgi:hypothetical protein
MVSSVIFGGGALQPTTVVTTRRTNRLRNFIETFPEKKVKTQPPREQGAPHRKIFHDVRYAHAKRCGG